MSGVVQNSARMGWLLYPHTNPNLLLILRKAMHTVFETCGHAQYSKREAKGPQMERAAEQIKEFKVEWLLCLGTGSHQRGVSSLCVDNGGTQGGHTQAGDLDSR